MFKNEYGQSGIWTLKLTVCQERADRANWFFACWYNFTQIKRWLKMFGASLVKNGCGQSGDGTLKLTISEEEIDEINWFFACWCLITKIKSWSKNFWVGMVKNGCGQSGHESKMNRWHKVIFSCWYEFRKAKGWFSYFSVGVVKNDHGFLVYETLKPAAPLEWNYELSCFLNTDGDAIIFG